MAKVFVITETNSYGNEEIVGACSSKEKADFVIEARKHGWAFGNFKTHIEELEIDGVIENIIRDLKLELERYEETKALLDKLKEL